MQKQGSKCARSRNSAILKIHFFRLLWSLILRISVCIVAKASFFLLEGSRVFQFFHIFLSFAVHFIIFAQRMSFWNRISFGPFLFLEILKTGGFFSFLSHFWDPGLLANERPSLGKEKRLSENVGSKKFEGRRMGFFEFRDTIQENDTVIIYISNDDLFPITVKKGEVKQTKFGSV